jgi:Carbohydrate-binding family 9
MEVLTVRKLRNNSSLVDLVDISNAMDDLEKEKLSYSPWPSFPYRPLVCFSLAYDKNLVFIKYYVEEKFVKAASGNINTAVYQDTCVEFFLAFGIDEGYYNFEFNCLGTGLVGFGKNKTDRKLLPIKLIRSIRYLSRINNKNDFIIHWELTLAIPFSVFTYHSITTLQGKRCRGNFYKCGDLLPDPHFIAWANINFPEPNFHLPAFFGDIIFE